ncbi:DUF982 domain-containing protein [Falsirhodobacter xinxiangensis]|uniref:DUF982 domain-containing protein n=1 Tax=Falsirhodobacter xinxiangensis TaxID=2530049 RepID=UPI0010A9FEBD|nr:DUF982 domain-containing protein [Rhodobacter xinxiangensis]
MAGREGKSTSIRPVTYQETISQYRTVADAHGMGKALIANCDQADPDYLAAARSCIAFAEGQGNAELVRADFIRAMTTAGIFMRD